MVLVEPLELESRDHVLNLNLSLETREENTYQLQTTLHEHTTLLTQNLTRLPTAPSPTS
jgi:hypothetical protein